MGREIKFRGWHTIKKIMFSAETMANDQLTLLPTGQFINVSGQSTKLSRIFSREEFIPIQFTGLLDKNRKEIYEGDIVVKKGYIWFDEGKPNYRGTVEWIYSQWQVVAHCINVDKRGISNGINEGLNDDGVEEGKKSGWEIIGNIYENPELLTQP